MTSFCTGTTCEWYSVQTYENHAEQPMIRAVCMCGGINHVILDMVDRGPVETNIPLMLIQQPCLSPPLHES